MHGTTRPTAWQANPADVLTFNREHHVRDVTFDEDRSQIRTGSPPQLEMLRWGIWRSRPARHSSCAGVGDGAVSTTRRM